MLKELSIEISNILDINSIICILTKLFIKVINYEENI